MCNAFLPMWNIAYTRFSHRHHKKFMSNFTHANAIVCIRTHSLCFTYFARHACVVCVSLLISFHPIEWAWMVFFLRILWAWMVLWIPFVRRSMEIQMRPYKLHINPWNKNQILCNSWLKPRIWISCECTKSFKNHVTINSSQIKSHVRIQNLCQFWLEALDSAKRYLLHVFWPKTNSQPRYREWKKTTSTNARNKLVALANAPIF